MSKPLYRPTLLVVTDNPTVHFWAKKHLEEQFFAMFAETEQEALGAMSAKLDFILLDAAFGNCDALHLCKQMRVVDKIVPIILITGKLKKSFRDRAYQAGVTDFLSDQLDTEELQKQVAAGQKAADLREKTVDLSGALAQPSTHAGRNMKTKMVFNEQGLQLLATAKENKVPVACLVIQIDHFEVWELKEELCQSLREFIQDLLRDTDLLIPSTEGRTILLLYNTPLDLANKVAGRLKERINNHPFSALRKMSVSIVVSILQAGDNGFQKMLDAAARSLKTQEDTP
ncbi:MAG: response regulator [Verrucomicrobia bacterium]|nr:response regulator [Verrucomicrobiota bacterium]MBU6446457.1 response regulator [Verrucomicrobiota bacterium]MDE3047161.1 response regulator [Verrucomicrobiota bacterium]